MPVGPVQAAKRALVRLLQALAAAYRVAVVVSRDSSDVEVNRAYRRVAANVHPDKGGSTKDVQCLNAARDEWLGARRRASGGQEGTERRRCSWACCTGEPAT